MKAIPPLWMLTHLNEQQLDFHNTKWHNNFELEVQEHKNTCTSTTFDGANL